MVRPALTARPAVSDGPVILKTAAINRCADGSMGIWPRQGHCPCVNCSATAKCATSSTIGPGCSQTITVNQTTMLRTASASAMRDDLDPLASMGALLSRMTTMHVGGYARVAA